MTAARDTPKAFFHYHQYGWTYWSDGSGAEPFMLVLKPVVMAVRSAWSRPW